MITSVGDCDVILDQCWANPGYLLKFPFITFVLVSHWEGCSPVHFKIKLRIFIHSDLVYIFQVDFSRSEEL